MRALRGLSHHVGAVLARQHPAQGVNHDLPHLVLMQRARQAYDGDDQGNEGQTQLECERKTKSTSFFKSLSGRLRDR